MKWGFMPDYCEYLHVYRLPARWQHSGEDPDGPKPSALTSGTEPFLLLLGWKTRFKHWKTWRTDRRKDRETRTFEHLHGYSGGRKRRKQVRDCGLNDMAERTGTHNLTWKKTDRWIGRHYVLCSDSMLMNPSCLLNVFLRHIFNWRSVTFWVEEQ